MPLGWLKAETTFIKFCTLLTWEPLYLEGERAIAPSSLSLSELSSCAAFLFPLIFWLCCWCWVVEFSRGAGCRRGDKGAIAASQLSLWVFGLAVLLVGWRSPPNFLRLGRLGFRTAVRSTQSLKNVYQSLCWVVLLVRVFSSQSRCRVRSLHYAC